MTVVKKVAAKKAIKKKVAKKKVAKKVAKKKTIGKAALKKTTGGKGSKGYGCKCPPPWAARKAGDSDGG